MEHGPADRVGRTGRNLRSRPSGTGSATGPGCTDGRAGFHLRSFRLPVPAIIASPWVEPGSVYNEEYRHTSLIATLRKVWNLGDTLTQRDASARTFDHVFTRDTPRDPQAWATFQAQPVPEWTLDEEVLGKALSTLGKAAAPGLIERARELGVTLPPQFDDPSVELTGALIIEVLRDISWHFFPQLAPKGGSGRP